MTQGKEKLPEHSQGGGIEIVDRKFFPKNLNLPCLFPVGACIFAAAFNEKRSLNKPN